MLDIVASPITMQRSLSRRGTSPATSQTSWSLSLGWSTRFPQDALTTTSHPNRSHRTERYPTPSPTSKGISNKMPPKICYPPPRRTSTNPIFDLCSVCDMGLSESGNKLRHIAHGSAAHFNLNISQQESSNTPYPVPANHPVY